LVKPGTLVDSVYQHVLAWKEALNAEGINISVWRIHRKIGMSGGLSQTSSCAKQGSTSARSGSNGCG
jgi:beta-phosphoglucomutase-like phosphatase (HAD superfamily)